MRKTTSHLVIARFSANHHVLSTGAAFQITPCSGSSYIKPNPASMGGTIRCDQRNLHREADPRNVEHRAKERRSSPESTSPLRYPRFFD